MASVRSPARRALGDKSTNIFRQTRGLDQTPKLDHSATAPKSTDLPAGLASNAALRLQLSPKIGQKRRREDLEDTRQVPPQMSQAQEQFLASQSIASTPLSSGTGVEQAADMVDSSAALRKSPPISPLTSFQASPDGPDAIEDQFEIHEEMSQRTLEKIHAVKFSQPTSQLVPPLRPAFTTELSQDSVRMSSFIDFDEHELRSDEDEGMMMISLPQRASAPMTLAPDSAVAQPNFAEKAQTLRTRLQLALYKVETNQTTRPFSRLQKPREPSPELPSIPIPILVSTHPNTTEPISSAYAFTTQVISNSPESRIAMARARMTNVKRPVVRNLGSLPIPRIMPGPFSARGMSSESDFPYEQKPPPASPPGNEMRAEVIRRGNKALQSPPMQQISQISQEVRNIPKTPHRVIGLWGDEAGGSRSGLVERKAGVANGLTSSVVKGEAASGLLELMRAATASHARIGATHHV